MGLAGLELNNVPADTAFALSHDGIGLQYDITGVKKTFSITPNDVEWGDGSTTYNTSLGSLSAVQQALQAVELPLGSTTLKVNKSLLCDGVTANEITSVNDGSIVVNNNTGGTTTPAITLITLELLVVF